MEIPLVINSSIVQVWKDPAISGEMIICKSSVVRGDYHPALHVCQVDLRAYKEREPLHLWVHSIEWFYRSQSNYTSNKNKYTKLNSNSRVVLCIVICWFMSCVIKCLVLCNVCCLQQRGTAEHKQFSKLLQQLKTNNMWPMQKLNHCTGTGTGFQRGIWGCRGAVLILPSQVKILWATIHIIGNNL